MGLISRIGQLFRNTRVPASSPLPSGDVAGNPIGGRGRSIISLPNTRIDWARMAGPLALNSIVAAAIGWVGRNVPQAPLVVRTPGGKVAENHPLAQLLRRPNPFYSYQVLMASTQASLIVSGNAYWYVVRDQANRPKELWVIPHNQIEPLWDPNATTENFLSGYRYNPSGVPFILPMESVIHFREGALDPANPRLSVSPLASAVRHVATDNEAQAYQAAILSNAGMPGVVITPKGDAQWAEGFKEDLPELFREKVGGDRRGEALALDGEVSITELGFGPEQMLLDHASDLPEARICSLIGIPPQVLQLKVGADNSTLNNTATFERMAWQNGILPRLNVICEEIEVQLLPLYEDRRNLSVSPDLTRVAALGDSKDNLYKRLALAAGGPFLTPDEARAEAGFEPLPDSLGTELRKPAGAQDPAQDPPAPAA